MVLFGTSLQILAAIAVVLILFIIAYYVFNREAINSIKQTSQLRNKIDIFKGVKDMKIIQTEKYNTSREERGGNYIDLKPSVNQESGIEFAYNFWLYQDSSLQTSRYTDNNPDKGLQREDIILLLRGSNKVIQYKNICRQTKYDIYTKCPLVKLENGGDSLTVEFNTKQSADAIHQGATNKCDSPSLTDWNDANSHKISVRGLKGNSNFDKKWFMVTIVLQDTYPKDSLPLRNKVRVHIYINGVLELDQYVDTKLNETDEHPSILKPNDDDFYIFPKLTWIDTSISNNVITTTIPNNMNKIMMADLSYFNYVPDMREIISLYQNGFTKSYAIPPNGNPDTTSDYFNALSETDGKKRQLYST